MQRDEIKSAGYAYYRVGLTALLLVLFGQLVLGIPHLSITSDEPSHVVAGLTYLRTGNLWVTPRHGHPPLLNVLCALPLLYQPDLPVLSSIPGWGDDFSSYVRAALPRLGPVERLAFVTRMPIVLLTMILGALTCRWAGERFGRISGLLALTLLAFDPNLLAHAQLATTDLGITLLGLITLYAAWRVTQESRNRYRWMWVMTTGLFLGLTLASKGSGFIYAPAIVAIILGSYLESWLTERRVKDINRLFVEGVGLAIVALLVLWAVYGFQIGPLPDGKIPMPFPAHIGVLRTIFRDTHRIAFLRGETRVGGWWWYFFYTTAVKTPLPLLIAGLWCLVVWMRRGPKHWMKTAPLLLFPALYWITALTSGMNIGHRHLMPTYPFAYILISQLVILRLPTSKFQRRLLRGAQAVLMIGYAVGALLIFPFYLAYFNPLAGGPKQGYRHLVDSNLAWGQSFVALRNYMAEQRIPEVRLSYYTYTDPAAYDINYEPLPPAVGVPTDIITPFAPQPAVYALSATTLQGIMVAHRDLYEWFRHRDPIAQPGYGMLVYDIRAEDVTVDWVAQCNKPVSPLPYEAIEKGFGSRPRLAEFDCTQAWLYPIGDGYYLLARDADLTNQSFVAQHLASYPLTYEQRKSGLYPAFSFYRSERLLEFVTDPVHIAPSAQPLAQVLTSSTMIPPLETDGPLIFLGAHFDPGPYRPGSVLGLTTYWHVTASPELRNLSIMGHLLAEDGSLVNNSDGLGVPVNQWHQGDDIAQHHAISIPLETPSGSYYLQSGAYWLDTFQRWSIADQGDRIVLGEVHVKP